MSESADNSRQVWAQVVAQSWADETYKQRLLDTPAAVLEEGGFSPPEGVSYEVHENTDTLLNFFIPTPDEYTAAKDDSEESGDLLHQVLGRGISDPTYKLALLTDPKRALAAEKIEVPEGVDIKVWENTASVRHLIMPKSPDSSELSDEELEAITGGRSSRRRITAEDTSGFGATL